MSTALPSRTAPSLWRRIAFGMISVTAVATLAAGIAAWVTTRALLLQNIDASLEERIGHFSRLGIPEGMLSGRYPMSPTASGDSPTITMLVYDLDGSERFRSAELDATVSLFGNAIIDGPSTTLHRSEGHSLRIRATQATVRTRRRWRDENRDDTRPEQRPDFRFENRPETAPPDDAAAPRPTEPPRLRGEPPPREEQPTVQIYLARDISDLEHELQRLAGVLGGLWFGATGLAALAAWSLRRSVLRPVVRLANAIQAIDPASLQPRPSTSDAPIELANVVSCLNTLLARVDGVLAREKATIGHIAHELRTPVAGLRTTLEFATARDDGESAHETYNTCLGVIATMQSQIETLLRLTRLEAGAETVTLATVDLSELLRVTGDEFSARAHERSITFQWECVESAVMSTGREALQVIVRNILNNAVSHAPCRSTVSIALAAHHGGWQIRVSNPTSLTDASQVFEAFWRGDKARSSGHSGLGLALCQRLATLINAHLTASIEDSQFVMRLTLPRGQETVSPRS